MPEYTHQESFNMLVAYAATMTETSIEGGQCLYRKKDVDGNTCNKCFVGAMILDEHYDPNMETKIAGTSVIVQALTASGHDGRAPFWDEAQLIHDAYPISGWKRELQELAKQHNLEFPEDVEFPVLLPSN